MMLSVQAATLPQALDKVKAEVEGDKGAPWQAEVTLQNVRFEYDRFEGGGGFETPFWDFWVREK